MAMSRFAVVRGLWDDTELPPIAIMGAMTIMDKAACTRTKSNVVAASFSAYKMYETSTNETVSFFQKHMVPKLGITNLVADEQRLLASIGWTLPSRTRMDCVDALADEIGANSINLARAALLAMTVPECIAMEEDCFARIVLFATCQMDMAEDSPPEWLRQLPTAEVTRNHILLWGLRVAHLAGPAEEVHTDAACGTKRKRC